MIKSRKKETVFVGLSGGVDSSVAAALLKQAGYNVVGVFIRVWEPPGRPCTWRAERREAMRVAARLDLPLLTLDLAETYKRGVVDYLVREYAAGRTPNPDVMCNKEVKFGAFYDWARARGADYVATGHYAQIKNGALCRAVDDNKDQTYFLWTLRADQVPHVLFPVGTYLKSEVRRLAKRFGLPTAAKPDSQGLCFIGQLDFKEFLHEFIPAQPGPVLNLSGEIIGQHDGAAFYTVGERHGFQVRARAAESEALYVVERRIATNELVVAPRAQIVTAAANQEIELKETNWLTGQVPHDGAGYEARIRHRGGLLPCELRWEKTTARVLIKFSQAPQAVAAGQSLVLYCGQTCLGGGIISC